MARPAGLRSDLTVMGGGVFGLACAFAAARRGARVTLIERQSIGAGSSGGPVGALSPHVPEAWNPKKAFQLDSLLMAPAFWADVQALSGLSTGYARTGRLQPIADAAALTLARQRQTSAQALWQGHAAWTVEPAPTDGPTDSLTPHSATGLIIRDTLSARLAPRLALAALSQALQALGGRVLTGDTPPPGAPVLWATGIAGLDALSTDLGKTVGTGVKGQALRLRHVAPGAPQLLCDGLHIVPHADGSVAIGSTSEHHWDSPDATDAAVDALHARAVAACPALRGAPVLDRWAGIRPRAASRAPMLGPWPGREGHFIANGGFKIGFGMAPKVAQVMADLILDGRDSLPEAFRVEASLAPRKPR